MAPLLKIERIECVPLSMPLPRTFRGNNDFMTHRLVCLQFDERFAHCDLVLDLFRPAQNLEGFHCGAELRDGWLSVDHRVIDGRTGNRGRADEFYDCRPAPRSSRT